MTYHRNPLRIRLANPGCAHIKVPNNIELLVGATTQAEIDQAKREAQQRGKQLVTCIPDFIKVLKFLRRRLRKDAAEGSQEEVLDLYSIDADGTSTPKDEEEGGSSAGKEQSPKPQKNTAPEKKPEEATYYPFIIEEPDSEKTALRFNEKGVLELTKLDARNRNSSLGTLAQAAMIYGLYRKNVNYEKLYCDENLVGSIEGVKKLLINLAALGGGALAAYGAGEKQRAGTEGYFAHPSPYLKIWKGDISASGVETLSILAYAPAMLFYLKNIRAAGTALITDLMNFLKKHLYGIAPDLTETVTDEALILASAELYQSFGVPKERDGDPTPAERAKQYILGIFYGLANLGMVTRQMILSNNGAPLTAGQTGKDIGVSFTNTCVGIRNSLKVIRDEEKKLHKKLDKTARADNHNMLVLQTAIEHHFKILNKFIEEQFLQHKRTILHKLWGFENEDIREFIDTRMKRLHSKLALVDLKDLGAQIKAIQKEIKVLQGEFDKFRETKYKENLGTSARLTVPPYDASHDRVYFRVGFTDERPFVTLAKDALSKTFAAGAVVSNFFGVIDALKFFVPLKICQGLNPVTAFAGLLGSIGAYSLNLNDTDAAAEWLFNKWFLPTIRVVAQSGPDAHKYQDASCVREIWDQFTGKLTISNLLGYGLSAIAAVSGLTYTIGPLESYLKDHLPESAIRLLGVGTGLMTFLLMATTKGTPSANLLETILDSSFDLIIYLLSFFSKDVEKWNDKTKEYFKVALLGSLNRYKFPGTDEPLVSDKMIAPFTINEGWVEYQNKKIQLFLDEIKTQTEIINRIAKERGLGADRKISIEKLTSILSDELKGDRKTIIDNLEETLAAIFKLHEALTGNGVLDDMADDFSRFQMTPEEEAARKAQKSRESSVFNSCFGCCCLFSRRPDDEGYRRADDEDYDEKAPMTPRKAFDAEEGGAGFSALDLSYGTI